MNTKDQIINEIKAEALMLRLHPDREDVWAAFKSRLQDAMNRIEKETREEIREWAEFMRTGMTDGPYYEVLSDLLAFLEAPSREAGEEIRNKQDEEDN